MNISWFVFPSRLSFKLFLNQSASQFIFLVIIATHSLLSDVFNADHIFLILFFVLWLKTWNKYTDSILFLETGFLNSFPGDFKGVLRSVIFPQGKQTSVVFLKTLTWKWKLSLGGKCVWMYLNTFKHILNVFECRGVSKCTLEDVEQTVCPEGEAVYSEKCFRCADASSSIMTVKSCFHGQTFILSIIRN